MVDKINAKLYLTIFITIMVTIYYQNYLESKGCNTRNLDETIIKCVYRILFF